MIRSVYIQIPFCKTICSYCDFCKMLYNEELIKKYLEALKREIELNYNGEILKTIYIGGGTPSCLSIEQLSVLKEIISIFKLDHDYEFTIETNIDDLSEEKLVFYKSMGVNRLSIGIQTTNDKYLKLLNRSHHDIKEKINLVKRFFSNINIDFMYGFPNQTMEDLNKDLEFFKELEVNHISIYSLILEEHTKLYIDGVKSIDEDTESNMYYYIINYLESNGYKHYEISNFAKDGYQSRHNLTYWNNHEYYGFGLGASGYVNSVRYTNTRSIKKYLDGNYILDKEYQTRQLKIENEMILGLRKITGVSQTDFFSKYGCHIMEVFDIISLIDRKLIMCNEEYVFIPKDKLYVQNQVLINFIGGINDRPN